MTLPTICPLCLADATEQSVESRVVAGGNPRHSYFRCKGCDVRYLWPRLDPEEETHFYRSEFAEFMQTRDGSHKQRLEPHTHRERNETLRVERMQQLAPYLPSSGSILEVGCASGFMLLPLMESGLACTAVEPSGLFQSELNARGLPTYESMNALKSDEPQEFNLIFHYFVLEHVGDPEDFLRDQIKLLAPGGHLVFEIPCGNDALLDIYDLNAFRDFYFQIGHQWVFTPTSLDYVLSKLDVPYSISTRQRYGLANHLTWVRHGRPGGDESLHSIFGIELDERYRERLVATGHADTLIGVISR